MKDVQIKVFRGATGDGLGVQAVEAAVNEWLAENKGLEVEGIRFSIAETTDAAVMVIYHPVAPSALEERGPRRV